MDPRECFDQLALGRHLGQAIAGTPLARSANARARLGEFVDFDDTAPLDPPQPMARIIGGPHDGEWTENGEERDYFASPGPPPPFEPVPPGVTRAEDLPPVVVRRFEYVREHRRPCPDSCSVAVYELRD